MCLANGARVFVLFTRIILLMTQENNKLEDDDEKPPRVFHVIEPSEGKTGDNEGVSRNIAGPRIRVRRKQLGWTQQRLAEELSKFSEGKWTPNQPEVRRLEVQRKIISDREIVLICGAMQISASWLLGEPDSPDPALPESDSQK